VPEPSVSCFHPTPCRTTRFRPALLDQAHHRVRLGHRVSHRVVRDRHARDEHDAALILRPHQAARIDRDGAFTDEKRTYSHGSWSAWPWRTAREVLPKRAGRPSSRFVWFCGELASVGEQGEDVPNARRKSAAQVIPHCRTRTSRPDHPAASRFARRNVPPRSTSRSVFPAAPASRFAPRNVPSRSTSRSVSPLRPHPGSRPGTSLPARPRGPSSLRPYPGADAGKWLSA
jgi:hypothetical protein